MTTKAADYIAVPRKVPRKAPGLAEALAYAFRADIDINERDGELVFKDPNKQLVDWLREALITHKEQIIWQIGMGRKWTYIYNRMTDLRFKESAFKGIDREQSIARVAEYIELFYADCDLPEGYTAIGDPFSWHALVDLRVEFAELTAPGKLYPIAADDPRERGVNGALIEDEALYRGGR